MDHIPIRVSTLRGDQKIDFDAYIKINDKFILYLRQGDSFEGERLKRLKDKKLKKMFILPDHEEHYRTYLTRNIEAAYNKDSGKSMDNRVQIIHGSQQSHAEAVVENPENEMIYNEAKDGASQFVGFLTHEDPEAFKYLMSLDNIDSNIAHHGVTVSTLANALAKKLTITDPKQLQMLTLGALLHDFEHFQSGLSIARPLKDFSPTELAIYKSHPNESGKKVQDKKHFDTTVLNIITQHEEFIDGQGFPNGLTEAKTDPLAVIVSSCNALDRLITFEKVPKKEAVKKLLITAVGKHPLQHLQLLGDIMSVLP